ncbi:hypothetical protein [Peribacillus muralis]|uniref:hypothetical protein n=1 Tax=Peribacillus muralis TaxID=264697 RepID=UPI00366C2F74
MRDYVRQPQAESQGGSRTASGKLSACSAIERSKYKLQICGEMFFLYVTTEWNETVGSNTPA